MDIIDYFNKIQDSMVKTFNKSFSKLNKSMSSKLKSPSCEISQNKDAVLIKSELPGMAKRDISLHITHDYLEIFAKKQVKKEKKTKRSYKKSEKVYGYRRVIPLPPGLITDKIHAKFNKGKLVIKIPKVKVGKVKVK